MALVLLAAALTAQESPLLRVTTRVVQVNVVATGKNGEPVDGLTMDDFILTENGRPQKITSFSVDRLRVLPPPAEPLPADLYTNRYELKGGAPTSATVVLFDLLNTRMRDRYFARDEFAKFLRKQLQPADRVALYVLGNDLRLVHDFTSDAGELLRALEVSRRAVTLLDSFDPEKDAAGNTTKADQVISDLHAVSRVHQTMGALEAIGNRLAALPGRKNLVWVTGGTPFQMGLDGGLSQQEKKYNIARLRLFNEELERAARRLDAADVAVYPVDAQGLLAMAGPRAGLPENFMAARDTMKILAARTGGRATVDTNDIAGAVRRALDDSRITYTLSYQPDHGKWDGRFQPIKVAVKRPGVALHHRGGYYRLRVVARDVTTGATGTVEIVRRKPAGAR